MSGVPKSQHIPRTPVAGLEFEFWVSGVGFGDLGFQVSGLGVRGFGFRILSLGRVCATRRHRVGFRVSGLGFLVSGFGFWV